MKNVLVTGGSGFVGGHAILQLLDRGYVVRTTVRTPAREPELRALAKGRPLEVVVADLERDEGWADATRGCQYVLHVASPFPSGVPKHEDEIIVPARDGALRVLRAAREAGVRRVVLTSSFAAVGYGHPPQAAPFDETSWANLDAPLPPYIRSKAIAERAAWDFMEKEGGALELAVVNPVGIFGPALGPDLSGSLTLVQRLLSGGMPGCPDLSFGVVDVRDVVDLHLRAMIDPAARGERFLAVAGESMSMREVAELLRARLGTAAEKVPTRRLPSWLVRLFALVNPELRQVVPELGKVKNSTSNKAQRLLGWTPRSREDAIAATGESLIRLGLV